MTMYVGVFSGAKVAAEEERFDALKERRVSCHHVNKLAVLRASLAHDHLPVLFNYLSLDFARVFVHQRFERGRTADDGIANFLNATRAKTVGLAWEAERRRTALVRFQQRARRPFRTNRLALRQQGVDRLKSFPGDVRKIGQQLGAFHSGELAFV